MGLLALEGLTPERALMATTPHCSVEGIQGAVGTCGIGQGRDHVSACVVEARSLHRKGTEPWPPGSVTPL